LALLWAGAAEGQQAPAPQDQDQDQDQRDGSAKLGSLLSPRTESPPSPTPEIDAIELRLRQLQGRRDAAHARQALEAAAAALASARKRRAASQPEATERAKQRAWAALTWASRLLARAQTAEELAATLRRAEAAERQAARAQKELMAAQRELDEARGRQP